MADREAAHQRGAQAADRMWKDMFSDVKVRMGHSHVERISQEIDSLERMMAYKRGQLSRLLDHLRKAESE